MPRFSSSLSLPPREIPPVQHNHYTEYRERGWVLARSGATSHGEEHDHRYCVIVTLVLGERTRDWNVAGHVALPQLEVACKMLDGSL